MLDLPLIRRDALLVDDLTLTEDLATLVIDPFKLSPKDDVLCLLMRLDCRFLSEVWDESESLLLFVAENEPVKLAFRLEAIALELLLTLLP